MPTQWSYPLADFYGGTFSHAAVSTQVITEDYTHVDTARDAIFVGIFENTVQDRTLKIVEKFVLRFKEIARIRNSVDKGVFRAAFEATFAAFITSHIGSCLVAVIWGGNIFAANSSDGKVVVGGSKGISRGAVRAKILTSDDDSEAITRTIVNPNFYMKSLKDRDKCVLIASTKFWSYISPKEAVEFAMTSPRKNISKRLILEAFRKGMGDQQASTDMHAFWTAGQFPENLAVIVLYVDSPPSQSPPPIQVRSFNNGVLASRLDSALI